jgi:hypothetical protein
MARITTKLERDTHRRLVAALPELSAEEGRMLTISEAIEYLLASHHRNPYEAPGVPKGWAELQRGGISGKYPLA